MLALKTIFKETRALLEWEGAKGRYYASENVCAAAQYQHALLEPCLANWHPTKIEEITPNSIEIEYAFI